jgi:alcohol dehydrogenase, propanol-preferring
MRAWILDKQGPVEERPLKLVEFPIPHPKGNEIRLKNLVCGICRTDIHIVEGDLPLKKSPIILGHQVVGIVDEIGEKVSRFSVGDKAGIYWLYSSCGQCKNCLSGWENYCPAIQCTGWDANGGFAEYTTIAEAYALPLNDIPLEPFKIAPLLCPGIAGYAAFKLSGAQKGDKLGLYGFGPTAYFVLKVAQSIGIETYVSTRSVKNNENAHRAGATWVANTAREKMPVHLDAAIVFPPAGNLVEPVLSQVEIGGTLVLAPVSMSPIAIDNYSQNLWGRSIKTLYHLKRSDAEGFLKIIRGLDTDMGATLFPFESLPKALILVKHGRLDRPNAILKIAELDYR